jgi:hypothetical protein
MGVKSLILRHFSDNSQSGLAGILFRLSSFACCVGSFAKSGCKLFRVNFLFLGHGLILRVKKLTDGRAGNEVVVHIGIILLFVVPVLAVDKSETFIKRHRAFV